MTSTTPSVSDVRREAVETEGFDPKDDSAVPNGQTPFPTSLLNEGAVKEVIAKLRRIADEGAADEAASLLTTLLTNLAEAQRERDILRTLNKRNEDTIRLYAHQRDKAESRLSHLQTRLEEVEVALREVAALNYAHAATNGAAYKAHCIARAALQPKGEDDARELDLAVRARMHAFLDVDPTNGPCKCDVPVTDARRPTHCHLCGRLKRAALQPKGESRE